MPLVRDEGTVRLADGRVVAWSSWGPADGQPLLQLHGTPGSRLSRSADPELYDRVGANAVTFDRPGYGGSTPNRDRTVLDVADDALAVADAFGWGRFAVLGVSGGGPHALALGVRAPERVTRLGIAVGATPADLVDPDALIAHNREARRRALDEGRESLEEFLSEPARRAAEDPFGTIDYAMADAPEADREVLGRQGVREHLADSLREAFANGPTGWYDDSWTISTAWGFELADVRMPVHMWYGELDRNVPLAAVRTMASQLDVASLEILPDVGHLGWLAHEERVIRALLA
jgi:pimeloyl-ACP methyl ester carboxylesterase